MQPTNPGIALPLARSAKTSDVFTRDARRYLHGSIAAELNLANLVAVSDLERGQVFLADSPAGRVIVKVYPPSRARVAARAAAANDVLAKHGIRVPEILFANTPDGDSGSNARACLVFRFEHGEHMVVGDRDATRAAFRNLAAIHRIDASEFRDRDPGGMPPRSVDHGWPLAASHAGVAFDASDADVSMANAMSRALRPFGTIKTERLRAWVAAAAERTQVSDRSSALLHGDYHSKNLIFDDGDLVTIDLDNVHVGHFSRELGVALMRTVYGGSVKFPGTRLEAIFNDPAIRDAESAYLGAASTESALYWQQHRETFLFGAYLRSIRMLATRACTPEKYSSIKRIRFWGLAMARWRRASEYLEKAV